MARERRSARKKLSTEPGTTRGARVPASHIGRKGRGTRGRADGVSAAAIAVVALVLIAAVGGAGIWMTVRQGQEAHVQALEAERQRALAESEAVRAAEVARLERGALSADVPTVEPDRPLQPPPRDQFEGRGQIAGTIAVPDGQVSPQRWTVELVPSAILTGGNRAEYRRLDFEAGETEFRFEDLPLGGYEILVSTTGLQAPPWQVLLTKGRSDVRVSIGLEPFGRLAGRVIDAHGAPVAEVPVYLKPMPRGTLLEVATDGAGAFLFEDVTDGRWELLVGAVTNPLVPALEIDYEAPHRTLDPIEIPVLGALEVTVLDDAGTVVAGAQISGYGTTGGMVRVETDQSGRALLRFLPPGLFKLFVTHDFLGSGSQSETIEAGATAAVTVRLVTR